MDDVICSFGEEQSIAFIKDLLCLGNYDSYLYTTKAQQLRIIFKGKEINVQKAIYDWLSTTERKQNFGGK